MTLCIAARYPFGIMVRLPGPPGPRAILFATDSRLTEYYSRRTFDVKEKLFPICGNAGLVYAGVSEIGMRCVQRLQKLWEMGQVIKLPEILEKAHSIFKKEYATYEYNEYPLIFMLGIYDSTSDQGRLFSYQFPHFDRQEITGVNAIGSSLRVRELYKQKFDEFVKWRFSHGGVSDNPMEWINYLQIVFSNEIIELGLDPTVGGPIQTAIIDNGGFHWVAHAVRKDNGKWKETSRGEKGWRVIEVNSKREIARTNQYQEGVFNICE